MVHVNHMGALYTNEFFEALDGLKGNNNLTNMGFSGGPTSSISGFNTEMETHALRKGLETLLLVHFLNRRDRLCSTPILTIVQGMG